MTLGFYIGWLTGCLTILAIAPWRSAKQAPTVIGSDVQAPIARPAITRRRSWPWR